MILELVPATMAKLTSVTLPSGGVINYTWLNYKDSFQNENRWLQTRVKDGGTTTFQASNNLALLGQLWMSGENNSH